MARPIKEGLDYFPLDVDFHNDEKIEIIAGEFGVKGEAIAIRLLCAIYRQGYYIKWSEALKYKLAKQTGLSANLIQEVLTRLVKWGFFNEALFNSSDVLTSRGIQKRYKQITKKRKAGAENYWILDFPEFPQQKPAETIVNSEKTPVNSQKSTQSKVKESKGKESKEDEEGKNQPPSSSSKNTFDVSDFFPEHEAPTPEVIPDDAKDIHGQLLKALNKISLSPEEILIGEKLIFTGCTFEDIETARKEKNKNNLKYLRNIVCEVRDRRIQRKEAEHFEPEIY